VKALANDNYMFDTRTYEIEFSGGHSDEYNANLISENMYAQCDEEGNQLNLMECIFDHNTDARVMDHGDMYIKHGSSSHVRKTTLGWHLCVEWKYGTTSWEHLSDLKKNRPVEADEYSVSKNLHDSPAIFWWFPYVLKKRIHIIAAVTKKYHKRTHTLGIKVPKSWDDCVGLEKDNGNTLWQDAVMKEMKNVCLVFQIFNGGEAVYPTYQEIHCHNMIFDVNIEDFRRNARFVVGGQTTDTHHAMTYANVVLRKSVRIVLTLSAWLISRIPT
jgi:hypothetical protein